MQIGEFVTAQPVYFLEPVLRTLLNYMNNL